MDLVLLDASPSPEEKAAVDALLGTPRGAWDGGERGNPRDAHTAHGGREQRERRHLLLPALQALQMRVGWISEGGMNYVCERLSVPPAEAWSVATFYAMLATSPRPRRVVHVCDDITCRTRGAEEVIRALESKVGPALPHAAGGDHVHHDAAKAAWMRSPCLGLCDHAPAAMVTDAGSKPLERSLAGVSASDVIALLGGGVPSDDGAGLPATPQQGDSSLVLLARMGAKDPTDLEAYKRAGGYRALARAFELGAEKVIEEVIASKLTGRGGAAFPTGRKWEAVRRYPGPRHLVCNADESEPGTFKDRVLLCGDPFAVIESMTIAAFAAGCEKGWLYVRAEYPLAHERLASAIAAARKAGLLGERVMGSDFSFDIEIRRGSGAYICGEETALFESIEGYRGEPRSKPPFPVEVGLFGRPTVVNNVETLVNVLPIVLNGGATYARTGTEQSTGTRLFCLSGAVRKPGVYEVELGASLRSLVELAGGLPEGRKLSAILLGGAAGTFLRADEIDLKLTLEDARAANATLGSGVVLVFDDTTDLGDVLLRIASFFRDESCGQCVPCRVGTVRQEEALHRIVRAKGDPSRELALLDEIGAGMKDASICGLGQTAYAAVESAIKRLHWFGDPPATPGAVAMKQGPSPATKGAVPDSVPITVDGRAAMVRKGTTILQASRELGLQIPTLCYLETLAPANACRLCVVEVEGGRVLAPSCSRTAEPGMVIHTQSERVRQSRRMVLEMLASSVDLSTAPTLTPLLAEYGCRPERYGIPAKNGHHVNGHHVAIAGHHEPTAPGYAATVLQPPKIDNDLYMRDYGKCVLCYKCVEACGEDHQNTFAIAVAGRGFDAHISTEMDVPLGDSACVYCGNCVAVCPTGALMAKTEYDLRIVNQWDERRQTTTDTICPYCGVGCTLRLHVQDGRIVKATSPLDHDITLGNLCIKGRFGWRFVQPATTMPAPGRDAER